MPGGLPPAALSRITWRSRYLTDSGASEAARRLWKDNPDFYGLVPLAVVESRSQVVGTVYGWLGTSASTGRWKWVNYSAIPEEPVHPDDDEDSWLDAAIGSFNRAAGMLAAWSWDQAPAAMHTALQGFESLSPPKLRVALAERDGDRCHICDEPLNDDGPYDPSSPRKTFTDIDHVVPLALGGSHWWSNVRLAHHGCNLHKSDREPPLERGINRGALGDVVAQDSENREPGD